jgi:hypothetical protein
VKGPENINHQHESRLLAACASARVDRPATILCEEIDWDYFYRLARSHSLAPLVYRQLEASIKDQVPADVLQKFKKDYQENVARNVVLTDELISLVDSLAKEGIQAIPFKGPALAVAAYGDLNLRRFDDLDLIVRRADVTRAINILQRRGYTAAKSLNEEQQGMLLRTQHNLQFTRGRIIVELHWQVSSQLFASTVTAEELWQHRETITINGREMPTLASEDLLFALCVHGSRHVWQRLAWICDLDRIIRTQTKIDWQKLMERAHQANAGRLFLLGLALTQHLFDTNLPATVVDAIARDARVSQLVKEIERRLCDGPELRELGFGTVLRFNMLGRTDWRSRVRYCRFLLAPSDSDMEAMHLSKPLQFFYYVIRPFRLLLSATSRQTESTRAAGARN